MKRCLIILLIFSVFLSCNFIYQVIRKPAELIGLFVAGDYKTTSETWRAYEKLFRAHSTSIMTPKFLCALAQVESGGNPFITPEWRWRWTINLTRVYAPASSAVGLLQYTDGTFEEAKGFCIRDHKVVRTGDWLELDSCWFNFFYTRLSPSNSIEMTAARLHHHVDSILREYGRGDVSLKNKQRLAAVIHLCGVSKGRKFARHDFSFDAIPKCGTHSPRVYCHRIEIIMSALASFSGK